MQSLNEHTKNFGTIKSAYNSMLVDSVVSKDDTKKQAFKKYVKAIKENEILRAQFLIYNNIENKIESDVNKAIEYVKENISLLIKFNKKAIFEANSKLVTSVLFESAEKSELYDNITKLIFTKRSPETIDSICEATEAVAKHILTNKPKEVTDIIELPNSMITTIMVDKYNQTYADLDESEKKVLKTLIDSTDEEKSEVYSELIRECIDLIDAKFGSSNLDGKEKLLKVKDKLLKDTKVITEDFPKNISKLVELRESLKNS